MRLMYTKINDLLPRHRSRDRQHSPYSDTATGWTDRSSNPSTSKRYLSSENIPTSSGPPPPRTQSVPVFCAWGKEAGGIMLTTHLQLPPRLRTGGAIPLLPYMSPLNVLSGTNVKNEWSYTSTPPICLH